MENDLKQQLTEFSSHLARALDREIDPQTENGGVFFPTIDEVT